MFDFSGPDKTVHTMVLSGGPSDGRCHRVKFLGPSGGSSVGRSYRINRVRVIVRQPRRCRATAVRCHWRNNGLCKAQGPSGTGASLRGPQRNQFFCVPIQNVQCLQSDLAMLPIENERAKKLISKLVDIFAEEKARKRTF
jgi:hypothetical protein